MTPPIRRAIAPAARRFSTLAAMLLALLSLTACETAPPKPEPEPAPRDPAVQAARSLIGAPYRWGGASPREGFDCSGLVQYAYGRAGVPLPRSARDQYQTLKPLKPGEIFAGDLVFFRLGRGRGIHVGIYDEDGRFIHAPSSGKHVSYSSLHDPFWNSRFIGARRARPR